MDMAECEKQVVEKLIFILSKYVSCQSNDASIFSEQNFAEQVIVLLASKNGSIYDGETIPETIVDAQISTVTSENSTDVLTSKAIPIPTMAGVEPPFTGNNKLHNLEIIKVVVLIAVISIIMLSTCRMVFQLFIRFRPEKPPLD